MERRSSLSAMLVLVARGQRAQGLRSKGRWARGPNRVFLRRATRGSPPRRDVPPDAQRRRYPSAPPRNGSSRAVGAELTHGAVLGAPPLDPLGHAQRPEGGVVAEQRLVQGGGRPEGIAVRPARGLGEDLVDHAQREAVLGGQPE